MNDTGTVDLTEAELALLEQINFAADYRDGQQSVKAAAQLMALLIERDAIPARRAQYFLDPEWGSRGKSRQQVFEGNGTVGADIYSHGNFLKYLRFFIHGADLPRPVIDAMRVQVGNPDWFTSGDLEPTRKEARRLARLHGLDAGRADEFMQLGADLGLSASCADSIRRAVLSIRRI